MKKEIEVIELKVREIKNGFGNPRKISREKKEELRKSLDDYGDFGLILVDEDNNVIAGNQRVSILLQKNPDEVVLCKRLKGYTKAELRAINIKDNTHSGEWDLDLLADWTADLNVNLGVDLNNNDAEDIKLKDMELAHYEKYDYVVIACRNEVDYENLCESLGIKNRKVKISKTRKLRARAIWYDQMEAELVKKEGKK